MKILEGKNHTKYLRWNVRYYWWDFFLYKYLNCKCLVAARSISVQVVSLYNFYVIKRMRHLRVFFQFQVICTIGRILAFFLYTAALSFLLVESFHNFIVVSKICKTGKHCWKYMMFGWGKTQMLDDLYTVLNLTCCHVVKNWKTIINISVKMYPHIFLIRRIF